MWAYTPPFSDNKKDCEKGKKKKEGTKQKQSVQYNLETTEQGAHLP